MSDWFGTLDDTLWLKSDESGEDEARFIKRSLHLRKGQAVLDAPCGAGRIGFHLALAGCQVTGVDLRRDFINRARRRFRKAGLRGSFVVQDLREIDFDNQFDGIFNWSGSFGYFPEEDNFGLLSRYARALRSGRRLLIDQPNREYILRQFIPERPTETVVFRNSWDSSKQRIFSHWIIDGKNDPRNISSIRLYTPGQMNLLFEQADLKVESVYGSFGGNVYRKSSRRMITVGRKS